MAERGTSVGFIRRHLAPGDRLAEVLCGLIMVLTFTLGAGLTVEDGPDAALALLYAAIGCNVAWGIIDGVLYVLTAMSARSGQVGFIRAIQAAPDATTAAVLAQQGIDERLGAIATPTARAALTQDIVTTLRSAETGSAAVDRYAPGRITRADLGGALAIFWIEVLACVPAIVPFLLLRHDYLLALRVSNGVLVVMLFVVGWQWARYATLNRWLVGLVMAGLGLALVVVAMLLGG